MAAETTLLLTLRPGDHVVLADDVYGGTYRLLANVLWAWGLDGHHGRPRRCGGAPAALRPSTKLVWVETPSNPMLKIVDLAAVSAIAHAAGARVVVDNTFATPALQRPLELGADAVVHSVTKYLGGHSDLIGGAIVTSDAEWIERLGFLTNALGAVPGPMDCYLALRGLKTLAVRMRAHCENARAVAAFLASTRRCPPSTIRGSRRTRDTTSRHDRCRTSAAWSRSRSGRTPRRSRSWPGRALLPRRVAGRRGVADRGPRPDDARQRRGLAAGGSREPHPSLGGARAPRRPDRGPRAGARLAQDDLG